MVHESNSSTNVCTSCASKRSIAWDIDVAAVSPTLFYNNKHDTNPKHYINHLLVMFWKCLIHGC